MPASGRRHSRPGGLRYSGAALPAVPQAASPAPLCRPAAGGTAGRAVGVTPRRILKSYLTEHVESGNAVSIEEEIASVRRRLVWLAMALAAVCLGGCGARVTRVDKAIATRFFTTAMAPSPRTFDPQIVTGVPENHIITALFEGLVSEDPNDLHPVPGVAERWEASDDGRTYTFHLRHDAKWSNGKPVTLGDFVRSYQRMLMPSLAAEYAYMLYVVTNAEEFNKGKIKDFSKVGFETPDDFTLRVRLKGPTPYFLSLWADYCGSRPW